MKNFTWFWPKSKTVLLYWIANTMPSTSKQTSQVILMFISLFKKCFHSCVVGAYAKFDHHRSILSVSYTSNFPNTTQILLPYSENTAKLWSNPRRSCRKQSISFFNLALKMSKTKLCWISGGTELSSSQTTRPCSVTFAGMAHKKRKSSPKYWWELSWAS